MYMFISLVINVVESVNKFILKRYIHICICVEQNMKCTVYQDRHTFSFNIYIIDNIIDTVILKFNIPDIKF